MAINLPGVPFKLTAQDMGGLGGTDLAGSIQAGLNNFNTFQEARYKPKNMAEALLAKQLENKIQGVNAQYAEPMKQLQMQNQQANLAMNPLRMKLLEAQAQRQQQLANQPMGGMLSGVAKEAYAIDQLRQKYGENHPVYQNAKHAFDARINSLNSLSQLRGSGMQGGTAAIKDENYYNNAVARDNPDLSPEQIQEAANVYAQGGDTLNDGTKLNAPSPATTRALDRVIKSTTTSAVITQGIKANQAEAEIDVLQDYAQKGLKPYGNTFMGYSPKQIQDTFKSDETSQKQLGRFIASQALQYEIAQNRIRLANGQPGVTSTQELMQLSGQNVKSKFPHLTETARNEAARYMDEALKAGNRARQKSGISPSSLTKKVKEGFNTNQSKESNARVGYITDPKTGERARLLIPKNEWNDFIKDGGSAHA